VPPVGTMRTREGYAAWLHRQMSERGVSARELARRLSPEDPENARRAVRRYLSGTVPIARNRARIAQALGAEETWSADDEAEDD